MGLKPFGQNSNNNIKTENALPNNSASLQNTQSILLNTTIEEKTFESSKRIDKKGVIPNGIMRVFNSQIRVKTFNIICVSLLLFVAFILCLLFAFKPTLFIEATEKNPNPSSPWIWYVLLAIASILLTWKLIIDAISLVNLKRSINEYRDAINKGTQEVPAFVLLLYRKLMFNQVTHNWITIAFVFYFGIFTLIFWALKDAQWIKFDGATRADGSQVYVLDFKTWIHNSFPNTNLWIGLFSAIIAVVVLIHIVFSILRKIKISSIQSFMGLGAFNFNEIAKEKRKYNITLMKIFIISILVVLILPFIIYFIATRIIRRKK
ncbi:MSC_0882 family membrane protein [Mycoplasma sp. 128]